MSTTTGAAPARRRRRWQQAHLRAFAWLALLGMLLGPLAPRSANAREAEETEYVDTQLEEALTPSQARLVRRRGALGRGTGRPALREPVVPTIEAPRLAPRRLVRWQVPRRLPPDEDPDDDI